MAVTRPRVRLWIFDQGDEDRAKPSWWRRTPVFEFLERTMLCETVADAEGFARSSTPAEHVHAAKELYSRALEDKSGSAELFRTAAARWAEGGRPFEEKLCLGSVYALAAEDALADEAAARRATTLRLRAVAAWLQAATGVRSAKHREQAVKDARGVLVSMGDEGLASRIPQGAAAATGTAGTAAGVGGVEKETK